MLEDVLVIKSEGIEVISNIYRIQLQINAKQEKKYIANMQECIDAVQQALDMGIKTFVFALSNQLYDCLLRTMYCGGLYGLVQIWILPEYYLKIREGILIELSFLKISDFNKPRLESFQVHLTDICNLNCKGCGHFSNIAREANFLDMEEYESDLEQIKLKFWGVERIYLLGGEPLIYPQIVDAIELTRREFPDSEIHITTNGLLIPAMSDEFYETVRKTNSHIELSMYPETYRHKNEIARKLAEQKLEDTTILWGRIEFTKNLRQVKSSYPEETFENCFARKNACFLLRNGKLAVCPQMLLIDIFDKEYGIKRECSKEYIDLYADSGSGWDILNKLGKVTEMCAYCEKESVPFEWAVCGRTEATPEDWFV